MRRLEVNVPGSGHCRILVEGSFIEGVDRLGPEKAGASYLSAGFVDTQLNGFAGVHFSDPDMALKDLDGLLKAVWATGTTTVLPTLISNTPEALKAAFAKLETARRDLPRFDASVPCYHLEGPYMSPGPSAGAHRPEFMKNPDWEEFQSINEAAGGRIGIITIAPEWPGAAAFTRQAVHAGIRVALSHTDGKPEDVHRIADAGASLNTHLGNGCPQLLDRHQAPFWAQLANDRLKASIICDGFHLSREMVQIITRVKGAQNILLVTDAVFVAGLKPGKYELVGKPIELLETGQVVQADHSSMAGSTLNMADAVGNFMSMTGVTLAEALPCATSVPANYLDRPGICPEVAPGQPANLVLFELREDRLEIRETLLAGETVYASSGNR